MVQATMEMPTSAVPLPFLCGRGKEKEGKIKTFEPPNKGHIIFVHSREVVLSLEANSVLCREVFPMVFFFQRVLLTHRFFVGGDSSNPV